jgi:hypothetical protein
MELDREGGYYFKHVQAMTAEGLHEKSDIACELAWRDKRIDDLSCALSDMARLAEQYVDCSNNDEDRALVDEARAVLGL